MLASISALQAETKFSGDPSDTPVTLEQFGDLPGSSIPATGGNPDGYLLLTEAVNGQNNFATFDRTDEGPFPNSVFTFDFKIAPDATPSANGISFSYADTGIYGTSGGVGAPPFTPEDPAAAGVLGFGFDTWSNQGAFDDPNVPTGSDYQEISAFWDGNLIDRIDDTRLLDPPLTLDDGEWHTVVSTVDFDGGNVSLIVDGNPIHSGLAVQALHPSKVESCLLLGPVVRTSWPESIISLFKSLSRHRP
jgi:hypothetical protein